MFNDNSLLGLSSQRSGAADKNDPATTREPFKVIALDYKHRASARCATTRLKAVSNPSALVTWHFGIVQIRRLRRPTAIVNIITRCQGVASRRISWLLPAIPCHLLPANRQGPGIALPTAQEQFVGNHLAELSYNLVQPSVIQPLFRSSSLPRPHCCRLHVFFPTAIFQSFVLRLSDR